MSLIIQLSGMVVASTCTEAELLCQDQCRFLNNLATDTGGGIYAMGSSIIVGRKVWENAESKACALTFINNNAKKVESILNDLWLR